MRIAILFGLLALSACATKPQVKTVSLPPKVMEENCPLVQPLPHHTKKIKPVEDVKKDVVPEAAQSSAPVAPTTDKENPGVF